MLSLVCLLEDLLVQEIQSFVTSNGGKKMLLLMFLPRFPFSGFEKEEEVFVFFNLI